ncbi:MAG: ComEC/Rec2 family competence protein [Halovenus sp.]
MRRVFFVVALAAVLVTAGCAGNLATGSGEEDIQETGTPDGEFQIHHIDVGQADATLLIAPSDETMLIDSGDWRDDGETVLDYLDERDIDRIDHLVSTHAHADHIGGHARLIETYETERDGVGAVYDSGVAHTSQTYENYLDAVEEHDVDLFEVRGGDTLPLNETVTATVLNPAEEESGSDLHENSVALAIEFGEFEYLTTGDAEQEIESRLIEEWDSELDADVYQAGHHGSSTSSTPPFLDEVTPEMAVISSAVDSQYGHPHDEVLQRFADRDVETYWTGVHGDIVVTTDGNNVSVETEHSATTDPAELLDRKTEATSRIDPGIHSMIPRAQP